MTGSTCSLLPVGPDSFAGKHAGLCRPTQELGFGRPSLPVEGCSAQGLVILAAMVVLGGASDPPSEATDSEPVPPAASQQLTGESDTLLGSFQVGVRPGLFRGSFVSNAMYFLGSCSNSIPWEISCGEGGREATLCHLCGLGGYCWALRASSRLPGLGVGNALAAMEKHKPHTSSAHSVSDQGPPNLTPHTLQSSLAPLPCGPLCGRC